MEKTPILHNSNIPGQYDKVYWPIKKTIHSQEIMACIESGCMYTHMNTTQFKVVRIYDGKGTLGILPIVEYKRNDENYIYSTTAWWFAYNIIANLKK